MSVSTFRDTFYNSNANGREFIKFPRHEAISNESELKKKFGLFNNKRRSPSLDCFQAIRRTPVNTSAEMTGSSFHYMLTNDARWKAAALTNITQATEADKQNLDIASDQLLNGSRAFQKMIPFVPPLRVIKSNRQSATSITKKPFNQ